MKTVLFIDDNKAIIEIYKWAFKKSGWEFVAPETYEDGSKYLKEKGKEVSIVVVDLMMPNVTGGELLKCINKYVRDDIPRIIFSNIPEGIFHKEARDNGATHSFGKMGFLPPEFVAKVEEIYSEYLLKKL